MKFKLKL